VYVAAEELQLRGGPRTEVDLTIILPNWPLTKKFSSNTCTNCWHLEGCSQLAVEVISLHKALDSRALKNGLQNS